MATFELARYTIDPARADELVDRWQEAVAAIRSRFPGLVEANLVRIDDATWMDIWRWETHREALAAAEAAPHIPEAAAMFELIVAPPSMEHGDIVVHA